MNRAERWFLYSVAAFTLAFSVFLITFSVCLALGRV